MIGLTLSDAYRLTLEEFNVLYEEWDRYRTALYQTSWEQARFLAHCALMPYGKRGLMPQDLVRFEWDNEKNGTGKPATQEEFDRIREMYGD